MSVSSRIIARLMITTCVAGCIAYGWLYLKQSRVDRHLHERALLQQAREISRYLSIDDAGKLELMLPAALSEAYNSPGSTYRYIIRDEAGRIVAASNHRPELPLLFSKTGAAHEPKNKFADNDAVVPTRVAGRGLTIGVEQRIAKLHSLNASVFNEFITDGGWLGIPFLCALLLVSAYTVRKSLSPFGKLSSIAARINPGDTGIRLPQTGIPNEILPAISAINGGLDRLDEGFRRQREFCANVAHQLRTPLAVLSANLDLMADKAVAEKLRPDVDLMIRMVTQLLLISKLESLNIPLDHEIELRACAQEAAAKLGPVAIAMGKSLEVVEPDAPVYLHGNAPILISGISNLIENALKHSPPGSTVRIRVTSSPSIEVHDTGPGVPPSMQERIFERFWQGNDSQHGAGLGLSIVRQIMQALHGTVSVSQSPEGGAQFTLHFPQGKTVVQPPAPRNQGCVPAEPLLS
jgi:signal transduction histidine kinase